MNFDKDKIIDQVQGLAFGVLVGVAVAVGVEVYQAVEAAPDTALLSQAFWVNVAAGAAITAIRSAFTAIGTALGVTIRGVSSGA